MPDYRIRWRIDTDLTYKNKAESNKTSDYGLYIPNTSTSIGVSGATINAANGDTVTITTSTAHRFSVGQQVTVAGVTPTAYNASYVVLTVPTSTSFTAIAMDVIAGNATSTSGATVKPDPVFFIKATNSLSDTLPAATYKVNVAYEPLIGAPSYGGDSVLATGSIPSASTINPDTATTLTGTSAVTDTSDATIARSTLNGVYGVVVTVKASYNSWTTMTLKYTFLGLAFSLSQTKATAINAKKVFFPMPAAAVGSVQVTANGTKSGYIVISQYTP